MSEEGKKEKEEGGRKILRDFTLEVPTGKRGMRKEIGVQINKARTWYYMDQR